MKNHLFSLALTLPLLALTACATDTAPTADTPEAEETTEATADADTEATGQKLALVLSGSSTDQSWDQAAYEAGKALEGKGVELAISEAVDPADVAAVLRQYAEEGYDLVVAHSFSYQDAVFEVAEEFPDVNFAWAGGIGESAEIVAEYDQRF
jgi:simple sugar transport system substrate-binding protein/basic membrane protein A